jgi:hypothetical protein
MGALFGDAKMTTGLLDRLTRRCHILETGNDSYHFKASAEISKQTRKLHQHEPHHEEQSMTTERVKPR